MVQEGSAALAVKTRAIVTRDMPVFYNPQMKLNRDLTLALLRALKRKNLVVADPLAGSGVRAIRMLKELPGSMIKEIHANDGSPLATKSIKANLNASGVASKKIKITTSDARDMLKKRLYDYIDIDPFGYPGPFMDAALAHLSPRGILAITATDTAALTGSAPGACRRKYHAVNLRGPLMHELGLRILIAWAAQKGKAHGINLMPLLSYEKDHYMRAFLVQKKGSQQIGTVWQCPACLDFGIGERAVCGCGAKTVVCGPLWLGKIGEMRIAKKTLGADKFQQTLLADTAESAVGLHDVHRLSKIHKFPALPPLESVILALRTKGYRAGRTTFNDVAIKTNASQKTILRTIRTCAARR